MKGNLRTVSLKEYAASLHRDVGVSDWFVVGQETIDSFANITRDRNPLHVEPAVAQRHGMPTTVAHGFLVLSFVAPMAYQACPAVEGTKTVLNYGLDHVRFVAPVMAGSRIRGHFRLENFELDEKKARWLSEFDVKIEIESEDKPAVVCRWKLAGLIHSPSVNTKTVDRERT